MSLLKSLGITSVQLFLPGKISIQEKYQLVSSSILSYIWIYHIFLIYINCSNHYSNILFNKAVLEPHVSPAFAITYFCNHCNILDLKIHQSMWIHWPFFPKTWTKGHWLLDDLWPHVCWGHMCDSTQGSLCPSPITIHQCMWIQWSILQNTTYIHIHTYYILRTEWVITSSGVSHSGVSSSRGVSHSGVSWSQFHPKMDFGNM